MIPERARLLLAEVDPLTRRFGAAGHRLYLVGGVVRDLLVGAGEGNDDVDLTTDAPPEVVKELVAPVVDGLWNQGERFGTIGVHLGGRAMEITTHRAEVYDPESRKPQVEFRGTDLVTDLQRRDFTVNAMALEVTTPEPELIDPFGGLDDLYGRRLRTPMAPEASFTDDPLRMMRAARFIARFELRPEAELVAAVEAMSDRLRIVSAERVRDELCKLVMVEDPSAGLWFLADTGLAEVVVPELPALRLEQDPVHRHKDVLTHTVAVVAKSPAVLKVRLAALFHDIGKPRTRTIGPRGVAFHHHDVVGARMTLRRMQELRFSNEMAHDVTELVRLHLRLHTYAMGWTDAAVRRFVRDAGPLLDELLALTRSDCTTRDRRKALALERRIDELEERIDDLRQREELAALRPDLDGRQVMDRLGVPAGPIVGAALAHLLELRIERGPLGYEDACRELDLWYDERAEGRDGAGPLPER